MLETNDLTDAIVDIARDAGDAILEIYHGDDLEVAHKSDNSPITLADKTAHNLIVSRLAELTPDIPVFSEESGDITYDQRKNWQRFWLVDPLDGTKEFIKRNGEFTVNIALIEGNRPVLGVVHAPDVGTTYTGSDQAGAFKLDNGQRQAIQCRALQDSVVMVASRSHGTDKLGALVACIENNIGAVEKTSMGSSLKLCLVAEGAADIYPRLAPTSEWDTAAAHAVVNAAGGEVVDTAFKPLVYNKENVLNPEFLVLGQSQAEWRFVQDALA